ncbi:2-C-methyl-D-erythritol 4-phosphate cytidylyltransferase [Nocardioides sp. YIM 152588]|uniref:2-C-methyl-D-erythritol 4-phosphate cytidylyltransferase n=1 Tax=Nocardioides sp. YIM 152588 TaxID=3158259 RepID=UPI0032E4418E
MSLPPTDPLPYDAVDPEDERPPSSGVIVDEARGALPFALIHGESLVATAAWAAGEAGVELVDASLGWDVVVDRGEPLVLHDPLCPMTPPEFIDACVRRAVEAGTVVVGVRPVTDTVKEVADGRIGATVDREALVAVCSPIVLPLDVLAAVVADGGLPSVDFADVVAHLRAAGHPVFLAEAPAEARRVASADDVAVLQAQTAPAY